MYWYLTVLKKYTDFSGRASRKEFWMFYLFNAIFGTVAMFFDNILGIAIESVGFGPIWGLYHIAILIPQLAVSVRRLHDVGMSGWYLLIILIPVILIFIEKLIVGAMGANQHVVNALSSLVIVFLLVVLSKDGTPGENKYGEDPKKRAKEIKSTQSL